MTKFDWWEEHLKYYESKGRAAADAGNFEWPHADIYTDDLQYQDENEAYKKGFKARRKELGNAFK